VLISNQREEDQSRKKREKENVSFVISRRGVVSLKVRLAQESNGCVHVTLRSVLISDCLESKGTLMERAGEFRVDVERIGGIFDDPVPISELPAAARPPEIRLVDGGPVELDGLCEIGHGRLNVLDHAKANTSLVQGLRKHMINVESCLSLVSEYGTRNQKERERDSEQWPRPCRKSLWHLS